MSYSSNTGEASLALYYVKAVVGKLKEEPKLLSCLDTYRIPCEAQFLNGVENTGTKLPIWLALDNKPLIKVHAHGKGARAANTGRTVHDNGMVGPDGTTKVIDMLQVVGCSIVWPVLEIQVLDVATCTTLASIVHCGGITRSSVNEVGGGNREPTRGDEPVAVEGQLVGAFSAL